MDSNNFKGGATFKTWLFRIVYTTAISRVRGKKYDFVSFEDHKLSDSELEETENAVGLLSAEERSYQLHKAMDLLAADERSILNFYYFEDLPREEPSADFTRLVMQRVRQEASKSPVTYQPLISARSWLRIFFGMFLFFLGAILLRTFFPGTENPVFTNWIYQIDYSFLSKPFQLLSNALNSLSFQFIGGSAAIALLLFADQLFTRMNER